MKRRKKEAEERSRYEIASLTRIKCFNSKNIKIRKNFLALGKALLTLLFQSLNSRFGHPKTQTMQTVQTVHLFFFLILVFAFTFDSHMFWLCSIIYQSVCYPQASETRWYVTVDVL